MKVVLFDTQRELPQILEMFIDGNTPCAVYASGPCLLRREDPATGEPMFPTGTYYKIWALHEPAEIVAGILVRNEVQFTYVIEEFETEDEARDPFMFVTDEEILDYCSGASKEE